MILRRCYWPATILLVIFQWQWKDCICHPFASHASFSTSTSNSAPPASLTWARNDSADSVAFIQARPTPSRFGFRQRKIHSSGQGFSLPPLLSSKLSPSSLSSSTVEPPASQPYKVIANCPDLGGEIIRIPGPEEDDDDDDDAGFLIAVGVPTFAVIPSHLQSTTSDDATTSSTISTSVDTANLATHQTKPTRQGLEAILQNPNAFFLKNAIPNQTCESIINLCENELEFGNFNAGKNNHGAMQIVISKEISDTLMSLIGPHVDLEGVVESEKELLGEEEKTNSSYSITGINRRFRVYRYAPNQDEQFAPHIDAGFPPGGVSLDDDENDGDADTDIGKDHAKKKPTLLWDASHQYSTSSEVVSRLTVLIYLNDDFSGGHTKFYSPLCEFDRASSWNADSSGKNTKNNEDQVIASIRPIAGSILVFPQAVSESAVERARYLWPLHEGSPVTSGKRPKYVIRTDVLFETTVKEEEDLPDEEKILFQHDDAVRQVFLPTSPMMSPLFLHHVNPLYNPHMGVENAGPLLYSLVRFTKCRNIVEVGAGYTTLWLLQALKDNDEEMQRVVDLNQEGRLRMLDYPFGTPALDEWESSSPPSSSSASSLLCIDNCEHQRQTASSAIHVARTLGLDPYLQFLQGDAFDALDTHFSHPESIDLLWCDFGVGSRMAEYASNVWKFVKPGGFLACHSTLTNARTREWLEGVRNQKGVEVTGIPAGEYAELSLLEPHKRFQNSVTILQKRREFEEPLYSEYA